MRYKNWPETRRDTPGILFKNVLKMVRDHGHYTAAEAIMDHVSPENYDKRELTNYEFDFHAIVNQGNSEGIYINCRLAGNFDDSEDRYVNVGIFKTLRCDVDAFKIMGELCGALVAYCGIYVNSNIVRYTPDKERKGMLCQYNMDMERIERFHALFSGYNPETTRHWLRFMGEHKTGKETYKADFDSLTDQFARVREEYGPEIAQTLYHNVWALALKPSQLMSAARRLKEGKTCMELVDLAERGMLF